VRKSIAPPNFDDSGITSRFPTIQLDGLLYPSQSVAA
jgi:hypothetical protein